MKTVIFTQGKEAQLPMSLHPGRVYFTTDTYKIFIDLEDNRILLSQGQPIPIYSSNETNNYSLIQQNSSNYLPGYQDIKEHENV